MTTFKLPVEDINIEPFMQKLPDFNRPSKLMRTDKVYEALISNIVPLTEEEKLFHINFLDDKSSQIFSFLPGQFVMLELPGFGEIPISISSSTMLKGQLQLCIRRAGKVTSMLHKAKIGTKVGIRGPFGTYFPMKQMIGKNILLIAGGLGIVPLRAPIFWVNENRSDYNNVSILYGVKSPDQILFDYQFKEWQTVYDYDLKIAVEEPHTGWQGDVGMVTDMLKKMTIDPDNTFAIVCGPPVMFKYVCDYLTWVGIPMNRMFVDLERRMHCGMGKCCRCMVGSTFTCVDGPVMDYWAVMNLKEAI